MMSKENKIRKNLLWIVMAFCILEVILVICDVISAFNHNLSLYNRQQEQKIIHIFSDSIERVENREASLTDIMISNIKREFPTSSSVYCFVAVNDQMIFIRDSNTTKELLKKNKISIEEYLNQKYTPPVTSDNQVGWTEKVVFNNKTKYFVSMGESSYEEGVITLGICSKEDYIIKKSRVDVFLLHIGMYILLFAIAFISTTYFLLRRIKSNQTEIGELENELANNRQLMEQLHEEVWKATNSNSSNTLYGFLGKEIVNDILSKLTEEQSMLTMKVFLRFDSASNEMLINIAFLLERISIFKSVSCLWNENEFLVVLLNVEEKDGELFEKYLRKQYLMKYKDQKFDDIRIHIEAVKEVKENAI